MPWGPRGLRFQIISSLALLILLMSGLLGFAVISISSTAIMRERKASIRLMQLSAARSIASAVSSDPTGEIVREMADSWIAGGSLDGIWLLDGSGHVRAALTTSAFKNLVPKANFPPTEVYEEIDLEGEAGPGPGRRHLFTQFPAGRGMGCVIVGTHAGKIKQPYYYLGTLLVLYLLVHGIAILVFGYFSLTHLIVQPVEKIRGEAVRLGEGKFNIPTERRGAKEIQEVSGALAAAASRLKDQRDQLVEKIDEIEKARMEILRSNEAVLRSQKLASVGRLTAGVAHEIGNPLTVITGFLDVLADEDLSREERTDYIGRMRKETERVSRIIRDLLTYARAEGREVERIRLEGVIREACDIMRPQKLVKNVKLDLVIEGDAPEVMANKDRMTQVMVNLLLNAAEAMVGEGTVTLRLRRGTDGRSAEIIVEDDGPGIPPDILEDIFDPFVTTKPEGQGTGLGLAVCHGIIVSLGGTIRAENVRGGGARFTVKIPAAPDRDSEPRTY